MTVTHCPKTTGKEVSAHPRCPCQLPSLAVRGGGPFLLARDSLRVSPRRAWGVGAPQHQPGLPWAVLLGVVKGPSENTAEGDLAAAVRL